MSRMGKEASRSPSKLVEARVTAAYASGAFSVKTDDGERLVKIRSLFSGIEYDYSAGDRVVVATDGSRHYIMGEVRVPTTDDNGKVVLRDVADDLIDLTRAKKIEIVNAVGERSRVLVDQSMILVDTGERCVTVWEKGQNKITNYIDALEYVMPGMASLVGMKGSKAYARYQWRSIADVEGLERALNHKPNAKSNAGSTFEVKLFDSQDSVTATMFAGGSDTANIEVKPNGSVELESNNTVVVTAANSITMNSNLVNLGASNPSNSVARADKVEDAVNLNVVEPYNNHTHSYILPLIPSGTIVTTPPLLRMPPVSNTGCNNVKGE